MNIILEKRTDVLRNNNTAQNQLIDILENYSKVSSELRIREPLHGDVDFTDLLAEFGNIRAIYFIEGEITSVTGIPSRVTVLECPKNLLIETPILPNSIIRLNLSHNYLSKIDLKNLKSLKQLLLKDNKIESVENLPPTLEEIDFEYNKLVRLDLVGLRAISKLNISNNPITVVENMEAQISELSIENTPTIDFRYLAPDAGANITEGIRNAAHAVVTEDAVSFKEALDKYFQLKSKYEKENYYAKKRKIYESLGKLKRGAKRRELIRKTAELKPKCIKCARPVGTIFSKKNDHYLAICGDTANPCALRIDLYIGTQSRLIDTIALFKKDLADIKEEIIEQKMNILFNYISEDKCVSIFNKQMKLFQEDTEILAEIIAKYNDSFDNEFKKTKINEKKRDIYSKIERSRGLLSEYKASGNREFLKESMLIQIRDILPETVAVRHLENEVVEMNKTRTLDEKDLTEYFLFKYPALLSKMEYSIAEPERVIKMNI
jgi:hypothetical protein